MRNDLLFRADRIATFDPPRLDLGTPTAPRTTPMVILPPGVAAEGLPNAPQRLVLMDAQGIRNGLSWTREAVPADLPCVLKAEVTLLPCREPGSSEYVMAATPRPDLDIVPLLHDRLCPVDGVVTQTARLIQSIEILPLRRFLSDVFSRTSVFWSYWTVPASTHRLHAYPGGLANHALDMACRVPVAWPALERDLLRVCCFVHAIEVVIPPVEQGDGARATGVLDASQRRLDLLWSPLQALEDADPHLGTMLRMLVAERWVPDRGLRRQQVVFLRYLNALGQGSADRDRWRERMEQVPMPPGSDLIDPDPEDWDDGI